MAMKERRPDKRNAVAQELLAAAIGDAVSKHPQVGWVTAFTHAGHIDQLLLQKKQYSMDWIAEAPI